MYYITNARMPTEKAHGYQIAKMCEAFAALGTEVSLIVPARKNEITRSVYEYYGIEPIFGFRTLPLFDWLTLEKYMGKLSFYLLSLNFLMRARRLAPPKDTVIYTRTPEIAWLFSRRGHETAFECHQIPTKRKGLFARFISKCRLITTSSAGMKEDLLRIIPGLDAAKVVVAPNGFDPRIFADPTIDKAAARMKLGLPLDENAILYTGHLYSWKGVDILAQAAKLLPPGAATYFVGGLEKDRLAFSRKYPDKRIRPIPFQPRDKVALWLKAADILVLPNSPTNALSERHTSPIKMFEYMASGTPIVASGLPSIMEILDEHNSVLFKPDDAVDLAEKIVRLLQDADLRGRVSRRATEDVRRFTWQNRAMKILGHLTGQII